MGPFSCGLNKLVFLFTVGLKVICNTISVARCLLLAAVAGAAAAQVSAHPLSQFSVNHFNTLEFRPGSLRVHTLIDIAEIPSFRELGLIDTDNDSQLTREEIDAYLRRRVPEIRSTLSLTLDGREIPLQIDHEAIRFYPGLARVTCAQILAQFSAEMPSLSAAAAVTFRENSFPENKKDFGQLRLRFLGGLQIPIQLIHRIDSRPVELVPETEDTWLIPSGDVALTIVPGAVEAEVGSQIGFPYVDTLVSPTIIPPEPLQLGEDGFIPIFRSEKSQPTAEQQVAVLQPRAIQSFPALPPSAVPIPTTEPKVSAAERELGELIHRRDLSPLVVLIALVLAVFYGAGHALTPGHGKTLVAAYLVGSRGTVWHAIYLGLIVTVTHMGSVFIVGLVVLHLQPTGNLIPVMEGISGLLITGIGFYLFLSRYRELVRGNALASLGADREPDHHDHSHSHHHDHNHPHHHHHGHSHEIPAGASLWDLLALGISGGMVPCPTAIVVLMVAINIGRTAFGLMLITAFSVGLAAVLIVIGILVVRAKHMLELFSYSGRVIRILPVFSGILITCIGFWLTVYALIRAGIIVVAL